MRALDQFRELFGHIAERGAARPTEAFGADKSERDAQSALPAAGRQAASPATRPVEPPAQTFGAHHPAVWPR